MTPLVAPPWARHLHLRAQHALFFLALSLAPTTVAARTPSRTEGLVYNYIIAVGCITLVAIYIPLHALLTKRRTRVAFQLIALLAALLSSVASFVGFGFGGKAWQTLPTGVFMLFLAMLVALRIAGGWHVVRQRARAPNRIRLSILEDKHWRADISKDEYTKLLYSSGVTREMVMLGSESDQDAVAVGLVRQRTWNDLSPKYSGEDSTSPAVEEGGPGTSGLGQGATHTHLHGRLTGNQDPTTASATASDRSAASGQTVLLAGRAVPFVDRHEPNGLLLMGAVKHANKWMPPLLDALRESVPKSRMLALAHDISMAMWWVGMALGALAKTGFTDKKGEFTGSEGLQVGGIWLQSVLLLLAIFTLPYTRAVSRFGVRFVPRLVTAFGQGALSLGLGIALIFAAREKEVDGNNVAYAGGLLLAATAATLWSFFAVHAHLAVVKRLLAGGAGVKSQAQSESATALADVEGGHLAVGRPSDATAPLSLHEKRRAYVAALATRPRHGYTTGQNAVMIWGEAGPANRAPLEVTVDFDEDVSTEGGDAIVHDAEAGHEWAMLEGAARKKRFTNT